MPWTECGRMDERPTWGAPKIREKRIREYPQIKPPATSTAHFDNALAGGNFAVAIAAAAHLH